MISDNLRGEGYSLPFFPGFGQTKTQGWDSLLDSTQVWALLIDKVGNFDWSVVSCQPNKAALYLAHQVYPKQHTHAKATNAAKLFVVLVWVSSRHMMDSGGNSWMFTIYPTIDHTWHLARQV